MITQEHRKKTFLAPDLQTVLSLSSFFAREGICSSKNFSFSCDLFTERSNNDTVTLKEMCHLPSIFCLVLESSQDLMNFCSIDNVLIGFLFYFFC